MKDKQISLPETLFLDIVRMMSIDEPDDELIDRVRKGVYDKLDRMIEHDLYTTYKTGVTEEQREAARQAYAQRKGIPKDFRW